MASTQVQKGVIKMNQKIHSPYFMELIICFRREGFAVVGV